MANNLLPDLNHFIDIELLELKESWVLLRRDSDTLPKICTFSQPSLNLLTAFYQGDYREKGVIRDYWTVALN